MTGRVHDTIVVGSGIGGLTAAALCAAEGRDVLVLEGHTRPGWCAGDFRRRRVLFPAGATVVMGFEEGGLHRWVYERLGLPMQARPRDLAMQVHLPDREVAVHADRDAWHVELRRAFPERGERGTRFWAHVERLADVAHDLASRRPVLPLQTAADALANLHLVRPSLLRATPALPALWQSVGDLLRASRVDGYVPLRTFVDNQLLISMQCGADECVALSGALALEVYRYGTFELPAGPATIAADLVGALERRGGSIRYHAWVRQLEPSADGWIATTADGDTFAARTIVANLPSENVAGLLAPALRQGPGRPRHDHQQPWGAVVLNAALDPTGLPGRLPRYHQVVQRYDGALEDGGSCFVSLFGPEDGQPGGPARLSVSTHTRVGPWWGLRDRPAYLEQKSILGERLLTAAEVAIPDVRARVRFAEVATPRTFWRWTGRHEGRVGGFAQTRTQANLLAPSHRTHLPGLVLCGDAVFPGQGTIGVTLSGIIAARATARHLDASRRRAWIAMPVLDRARWLGSQQDIGR